MASHYQPPRDRGGRFARGKNSPPPPQPAPRLPLTRLTGSPAVDTHIDSSTDYARLWEQATTGSRDVRAFEYSAVTVDNDLYWGTVWASSPEEARNKAAHRYTSRGFDEGEFTIASVEPSPDDGFQDAQDTYRAVLESATGRWLLRESHYPSEDSGGWVAVNAVNEHLQIRLESGRWVLTEWDAGNGLTQPSVLELGSFPSPEDCVNAGDARLANRP